MTTQVTETKEIKGAVGIEKSRTWEHERKRENRKIKGVFQCHEPRGGSVEFVFKKFKGDAVERYKLQDGKEYELPLAVINHLNQNCNYPVYAEILSPDGLRQAEIGKRIQRYNFVVYPE